MGWQIAIVFDKNLNFDSLRILIGQMPVWALATEERRAVQKQLISEFEMFWAPEPVFTVFTDSFANDQVAKLLDLIPTITEHHPRLSSFSVFGMDFSDRLQTELMTLGYDTVPDPDRIYPDRLRFAKPVACIVDTPTIRLDASGWKTYEDFYRSFFVAVGAPDWHGHNLNALDDSIGSGGINKIEVPYRIVICNAARMGSGAAAFVEEDLGKLIQHLQGEGCPVDLVVENL